MGQGKGKVKKCRICKGSFQAQRIGQHCCSPACAVSYAQAQRAKKERKEFRAKKAQLKTRSDWMKEAQSAFNAYIRARDAGKPCVCCGLPLADDSVGGGYDCGHYRSVGSAPHLRFDERNAHGQRKQCNRWGSGRAVDYRLGLIARIGLDAVELLESDQSTKKWTIEDLQKIKAAYKAKLKELKGARA